MRRSGDVIIVALALLQTVGAVLWALVARAKVRLALRSPLSLLLALVVLFCLALGPVGLGLGGALLVVVWRTAGREEQAASVPWLLVAGFALVALARPWAPIYWDEFVWLAKARLEAAQFGAGVGAALDPSLKLIPAGYPPLFPSAVAWLSGGDDALHAHVLGAVAVTVVALAVCLEAWRGLTSSRASAWFCAVSVAAPFFWVHWRSAYVDVPVGLLGAAALGFLLAGRVAQASVVAVFVAGLKDEGALHVAAATAAVFVVRGLSRRTATLGLPLALAALTLGSWKLLLRLNEVSVVDHAARLPEARWLVELLSLSLQHSADVATWGAFWAVTLGVVLFHRATTDAGRALRWGTALTGLALFLAVACGSERVQAFAENGTLLNRLLVQAWPVAALLLVVELADARATSSD